MRVYLSRTEAALRAGTGPAFSISYRGDLRPASVRPRLLRTLAYAAVFLLLWMAAANCSAQGTVPAVLLSDVHFDPFHNPHVFSQLRAAPIERWPAILDGTPDLVEDAERAAMLVECHAGGVDTPWALLKTALAAAHDAEVRPVFVTLSGDLLAHNFPCRFHHLAPSASAAELSAFSAKTVAFVALQLRQTFPRVPVYLALGNNDSGCADYRESAGSPFMQTAEELMRQGAMAGDPGGGKGRREPAFSAEGDYSVALPVPLRRGRLIVVEDVFDARQYASCSGAREHAAETDQVKWLRGQLSQARSRGEQVWVMGHIPPGIDAFASFAEYVLRPGELCSAPTQPFLHNSALADTLLDFADVIRVAIFGHTHMDEIRLLHRDENGSAPAAAVAVKLVPSITPYFGNHPAFMVADIEARTLVLKDWQTYVSPGPNGSSAPWTLAYRFSTTYHLPEFSAATVRQLADRFAGDRLGKDPLAKAYRDHFYAGDVGLYALGLEQVWPAYACSVREHDTAAFHRCLCPAEAPKTSPGT